MLIGSGHEIGFMWRKLCWKAGVHFGGEIWERGMRFGRYSAELNLQWSCECLSVRRERSSLRSFPSTCFTGGLSANFVGLVRHGSDSSEKVRAAVLKCIFLKVKINCNV